MDWKMDIRDSFHGHTKHSFVLNSCFIVGSVMWDYAGPWLSRLHTLLEPHALFNSPPRLLSQVGGVQRAHTRSLHFTLIYDSHPSRITFISESHRRITSFSDHTHFRFTSSDHILLGSHSFPIHIHDSHPFGSHLLLTRRIANG
jgi:hypothetical protein